MSNNRKKLTTFDLTNLVVGSIIGADIYIATAIGSRLIGPVSLLLWVASGIIALVIALSFSYCVTILPKVGGPYAYTGTVAGPFAGFMIGWSLLLAEWFSLAVFPVAFVQYFSALVPNINSLEQIGLKALFIGIIVSTNIIGVKAAGRANDILTIIKLSPLILIIIGGITYASLQPTVAISNFQPFIVGGASEAGQALVLIFWAFAGFELSTLPADMAERPERSIPRAIAIGMAIVSSFYLLTNLAVMATVDRVGLMESFSPIMDAATTMFSPLGEIAPIITLFIGIGALLSILGADESGTIGTSRLAYAMALDGNLPRKVAEPHPRFGTPYISIIILGITAFIASILGGITALISSSVLLLGLAYLATCLSAMGLIRRNPEQSVSLRGRRFIPILGAILSLLLISLIQPSTWIIGIILLSIGVPIYTLFSPKKELKELKALFTSNEERKKWAHCQSKRFLALPLHHIGSYLRRRND